MVAEKAPKARNGKKKSSKVLAENFDEICGLVARTSDVGLVRDFFRCLFTDSERDDFASRWMIVKEIAGGATQREIARKHGMSLCRITRGARELNKDGSAFAKMLAELETPVAGAN